LTDVQGGEQVVVRTHYYPAWTAWADGSRLALYDVGGQLAFRAPHAGSYTVHLQYPRYRALSLLAFAAFAIGLIVLSRMRSRSTHA
jgi:hypothetical protein